MPPPFADPSSPALWIAPLVAGLLAALCLWRAYVLGYRRRLVANLPTSRTTGVFIGLVELEGRAEAPAPVTSYLAGRPCVHYAWDVSERWSRTVTETYTDSKGNSRTRTRTESGWTSVASGGETLDFDLVDDEGRVLVRPEGADLEAATIYSETCGRSDPLYYGKGPRHSVANSDHRRRFVEHAIVQGAEVYVVGRAREREDVVAPEIAHDDGARMFLISTRGQDAVRRSLGVGQWGWAVFGGVLVAAGFAVGDLIAKLPAAERWPLYLAVAGGYAVVAALAWLLLSYNALVDLKNRVEAAWRQVDIQLQRRATLIPRLVRAVSGLATHEREVHTALAELRGQLGATAPGEAGPDPHQVRRSVALVAERHPELGADANFAQLQRELVATEQRIALARGYFTEIATHFNTRLETVPERWVGALARMRRRALIRAEAFEREPVAVELTPEAAADGSTA